MSKKTNTQTVADAVATAELREEILKMLQDNAEEPEDIADGEGTFTTFRTEYLITDIESLIHKAVAEKEAEIHKALRGDLLPILEATAKWEQAHKYADEIIVNTLEDEYGVERRRPIKAIYYSPLYKAQSVMLDKSHSPLPTGDLLSDCCRAEFNPLGFERDDGLWQEKCLKCGKPCEPQWFQEGKL